MDNSAENRENDPVFAPSASYMKSCRDYSEARVTGVDFANKLCWSERINDACASSKTWKHLKNDESTHTWPGIRKRVWVINLWYAYSSTYEQHLQASSRDGVFIRKFSAILYLTILSIVIGLIFLNYCRCCEISDVNGSSLFYIRVLSRAVEPDFEDGN